MHLLTEELEKYTHMLKECIKRYGNEGIGTLIVRINFLKYLIKINATTGQQDLFNTLKLDIISHYNYKRPDNIGYSKSIVSNDADEVLYKFNLEVFNQRYRPHLQDATQYVANLDHAPLITEDLQDSLWYLYVLDQNNNFLIFNKAIKVTDLIINRDIFTEKGTRVVHPILVPECLTVKAAGEICFIKSENNTTTGVIVNNKSGHFRPNPKSLLHVEAKIKKMFSNAKNFTIFSIPIGN